jgi:hypothetical protein
MKKNDWILLASIVAYSFLFWKEIPGLNFLLMNIILVGFLSWKNPAALRNRNFLLAAFGALISSASIFIYGPSAMILANFLSLLLVSVFSVNKNSSVPVAWIQSGINMFATVGYIILDWQERLKRNPQGEGKRGFITTRIFTVLIVLGIVFVFCLMYRESSVLFSKLTDKINLDFISFPWVAFTLFGSYIIYGFYYYRPWQALDAWDGSLPQDLRPSQKASWFDSLATPEGERFSAVVLLAGLNLLLLIVNGLDLAFILGDSSELPLGVTYAEYVHQGVGMLILSIVCAILVILYYFRGRLNFIAKSPLLRVLAISWIIQNIFMLLSSAWRNDLYIDVFGLTYLRIGVYVYLLLAGIGLVTMAWKVMRLKTNMFLLRVNSWLFYFVLVCGGLVNWDNFIANFNLKQSHAPDISYIQNLSWRAWPALAEYQTANGMEPAGEFKNQLFSFVSQYETLHEMKKWPSWVLAEDQVYGRIVALPEFDSATHVVVHAKNLEKLWFVAPFANVTHIDLSGNKISDISRAGQYKNVRHLNLSRNAELESLSGIEGMSSLRILSLKGTAVKDFTPLLSCPNLKKLYVGQISAEWRARLVAAHPKLQIIIEL